jgi:hypothetical protein
MREQYISKVDAAKLAQCERRSIYNRIARGVIETDPATGKIPVKEFDRVFPWVRQEQLHQLVASIPAGECALILIDSLGRERCLSVFQLIDGLPPGEKRAGDAA